MWRARYLVKAALSEGWRDAKNIVRRVVSEGASFSLNDLDRELERYLNSRAGYYVELGANDGITQSNTLLFEIKYGWSGLLIEPAPHNFMKCKRLRGKRNSVVRSACVPFEYPDATVSLQYADLMTIAPELDLDIGDASSHLQNAKQFLRSGDDMFKFEAPARPLSEILDEVKSPKTIDLLSLDVEGAELGVLNGVDHDRHRFRYILVECRDFERLDSYLTSNGYEFREKLSVHDYLFESDTVRR